MSRAVVLAISLMLAAGARAGELTIDYKGSPPLKGTFALKKAVLRPFEFSQSRPALAYTRLEVWFTNADIDVCAAGDIRNLARIPLQSKDEFILVWQTVGPGFIGEVSAERKAASDTFYAAFLASRWPEVDGAPMEFRLGSMTKPLASKYVIDVTSTKIVSLWSTLKSMWIVHHAGAPKGRWEDWHFDGAAFVRPGSAGPVFEFHTNSKPLAVDGVVEVTERCAPGTDAKYWQDR